MRFRFSALALIASTVYVLHLAASQDLDLYIHPRYILFTTAMAAIGLLVILAGGSDKASSTTTDHHWRLSMIPLVIILTAAVFLPARSLSSATVTQRATDASAPLTTTSSVPLSSLFAGSSKALELIDWSRLLKSNNDPAYYVNKPAKISGFVHDAGLGTDAVWLSRFAVTCCAVDAQPVSVPVMLSSWESHYEIDQWLAVEGEFKLIATDRGRQLVLIPKSVEIIEEPANPYAN